MAGRYPKPDDERRGRQKNLEWSQLPADSGLEPPVLPDFRIWQQATVDWWGDLWGKGQAVMWDRSGESLWTLAALMDDLFAGRAEASKVSAEIRQHEDRHGLNPKAMLQLRWRFADEVVEQPKASVELGSRKTAALKVLQGGG